MYTVSSRFGWLSTFHKPSSRLSFCAARLKRARCASHGLVSSAMDMAIVSDMVAGSASPALVTPETRANSRVYGGNERESKTAGLALPRGDALAPGLRVHIDDEPFGSRPDISIVLARRPDDAVNAFVIVVGVVVEQH